jgi:hypothetical protein
LGTAGEPGVPVDGWEKGDGAVPEVDDVDGKGAAGGALGLAGVLVSIIGLSGGASGLASVNAAGFELGAVESEDLAPVAAVPDAPLLAGFEAGDFTAGGNWSVVMSEGTGADCATAVCQTKAGQLKRAARITLSR